jgi:hypothetical protein
MRDNQGVAISHNSGFTPIDTAFPFSTPPSKNEQLETHRIEKFQRHELYGFTTNELAQLDCLPLRDLRQGNLSPNAILPILQRGTGRQHLSILTGIESTFTLYTMAMVCG